jgi:hypothetical protein
MRKVIVLLTVNLWALLILAAILVILLNGCGEYEPDEMEVDTTENISVNITDEGQQTSNQSIEDIVEVDAENKSWNPKLSYRLVRLIEDFNNGELDLYMNSKMILLKGNDVYVLVTSYLGEVENAEQEIMNVGAEMIKSYKDKNRIYAYVPINKILLLTEDVSIKFIEIPEMGTHG